MRIFAFVSLLSVFVSIDLSFSATESTRTQTQPTVTCILTDDVTSSGNPGRTLTSISLRTRTFYILTKYKNLPLGEHKYASEITDGSGRIINRTERSLNVKTVDYWTSTHYSPSQLSDTDGNWLAKVYIDGLEMAKLEFEVTAIAGPKKVLALGIGSENYSKSSRLAGGNYIYAGISVEPIYNNLIGIRYSVQLFPNTVQDDLVSFSYYKIFLWKR